MIRYRKQMVWITRIALSLLQYDIIHTKAHSFFNVTLLLRGCGTTFIRDNIRTSVDPNPNVHIVVAPKTLNAVYYLTVFKAALEANGFKSTTISVQERHLVVMML